MGWSEGEKVEGGKVGRREGWKVGRLEADSDFQTKIIYFVNIFIRFASNMET